MPAHDTPAYAPADTRPLLRDAAQWRQLQDIGYVQLPLLPADTVAALRAEFQRFHPVLPGAGFVSSTYSPDLAYKQAVSERLTQLIRPHLDRVFQQHRVLGAAFLYKMPGMQSSLPLHQDWTVVDEDRFVALNVWMPLVDADADNGTLHVLPGSHRVMRGLRAPTLPFCYAGHEALMHQHMPALPTQAGQAVVINQALAHHSPANLRDSVRPAITVGVVSAPARLRFYYRDAQAGTPQLEVFEQDDDFFLRFDDFHRDIFQRPRFGRPVGWQDHAVQRHSSAEVQAMIDTCQRLCPAPPLTLEALA